MGWQVAVCGPGECSAEEAGDARQVGELLADRGAVVLCGGGTGVMAAVAEGAHSRGGVVVGIGPGDHRDDLHRDLTVAVVTNLGQARNAILAWSADALITVGGSWGTLTEVAFALRRGGIPVVSLGGWRVWTVDGAVVPGITEAGSPAEAVSLACPSLP